jgi:hypothetical protein
MGRRKQLLALSFLISATIACAGEATPGAPGDETPPPAASIEAIATADMDLPFDSRSFEMGTAGFVPVRYPDSSNADWLNFFARDAASYGGIYGIHISPAEKKNVAGILEQVQLGYEQMEGISVYIAFSINPDDGPFTIRRGEELIRVVSEHAEKFKPRIISLGVESDAFYLEQAESYDLYVDYARLAYDVIKDASPQTLVMNNFQLDRMRGQAQLTGLQYTPNWELIDRFEGKIDLVSFTVYPFLQHHSVAEIPDDYLSEIRQHTDLPVMITETGWPSETLPSGVSGSEEEQIDYILKLVQQANMINVQTMIWVFPHDAEFGLAGGIFDHLSLRTNDGQPKAGWEMWKAIQRLPIE